MSLLLYIKNNIYKRVSFFKIYIKLGEIMDKTEIIVYGRGGLGAKTCAQVIAESALMSGKEIQAFPEYGPERRGAPVRAYVRISDKPIRTSSTIKEPSFVIVIDAGLFTVMPELNGFTCPIIVNTKKDKKEFKTKTKNLYLIDASKISQEQLKSNNPNMVLIGVLLKLISIIKFEDVKKVIEEEFTKKNKKELIEPNVNCLKKGKDYFK